MPTDTSIRPIRDDSEIRACARIMSETEPWITLRRDFDNCYQVLSDTKLELYVAHVGDALAGLIALDMHGTLAGYIRVLVVAPDWRNRGVGAQLIRFAEDRVFRASPNVFLLVSSFNPRAQQFYARQGYERIGELKNFVIAGASEILMRKTIGPRNGFQPRA